MSVKVVSLTLSFCRWWQPAIELQAIDRVNRIGQTQTCVLALALPPSSQRDC